MRVFLKIFIACLFSCVCQWASAQVNDDFSDGELLNNPLWQGDISDFVVNAGFQLELNAEAVSDTSTLVTAINLNTSAQIVWEFWMSMAFDPSNSNNLRFYLMSDQLNLKGNLNGYFLRIGENGAEDKIRLFRQEGAATSAVEIFNTGVNTFPTSPVGRIRVVREANGIWNISSDATGGTNFIPDGSVQDEEVISTAFSGFFLKYSAGNSNGFLIDDVIIQGQEVVDDNPPTLIDIEVLSANALDLQFSEALDESSAEVLTNYNVPGLGNPISAELDGVDPTLVHLSFGADFPGNVTQTLEVNGIEDLFSNTILATSEEFIYVLTGVAGFRDVVFNEIFADPTPSFGLPEAEFLELYNPSSSYIDLGGWTFVNTTTEKILPPFMLAPGAFVILCNSTNLDLFTPFGDVIPISSFTALSNAGDSLTLRNSSNVIIDIVSYDLDWYQSAEKEEGGWTLEQINPNTSCSGANNWIGSSYPLGGTPGEENSEFDESPDLIAPALLSVSTPNSQTLVFEFDEAITDNGDFLDLLTISEGLAPIDVSLSPNQMFLTYTISSAFALGVTYSFELSMVSDCPGNVGGPFNGELITGFEPEIGDIIITEIFPDPSPVLGLPEAEFVEFYNSTDHLIDLSACEFSGASFPPGTLIEANSYLVALSATNQQELPFYADAIPMEAWSSTFLTNGGKELTLTNSSLEIIDQVIYDLTWYQDGSKDDGGWSLERIHLEDPCSDKSNWRASVSPQGGTPGTINSVFDDSPDVIPPAIQSIFVPNVQNIQLNFTEPVDEASVLTAEFNITNGLSVVDVEFLDSPLTKVLLTLEPAMTEGIIYEFSALGIEDCWGNSLEGALTGFFALPEFAETGDLIVNEILSNPFDGGNDYIEIYNRSTKNISLNGWKLASEDDGIPAQINVIIESDFLLYPGEFALLTASSTGVSAYYPNTRVDRIIVMSGFPSYSNSIGVVYLLDPLEQVSDSVPYDDDMHYALLDDLDGVSLERLDYNRASSDRGNWHSAAEQEGFGTPGYENSQVAVAGLGNSTMSVEPEVFSPDNDGFQDVSLISYKFDKPGYSGTFSVYDNKGRLVKRLANNELLGTEGTFTWDGVDDQSRKAAIGIYVIVAELFNPDGGTELLKEPCVLGHKLN